MKKQSSPKHILYFCAVAILVLVILYSGLRILESTVFVQAPEADPPRPTKTIRRGDIDYFPRQDITTILILGIDQPGKAVSSGYHRNIGAADMAAVVVIDEKNENIRVLSLNRDTMVSMPVFGLGGKQAGTTTSQLALAHTYGSGLEDSCENTRQVISDFLGGVPIQYYVAMRLDAVPILTDAVGGVTVTVTEDFSAVDPTIVPGVQTLTGDQALHYVQTRKDVGDQLNLTRIQRQLDYISGFADVLGTLAREDTQSILDLYESVAPYLVSDLPIKTLSAMLERYQAYPLAELASLDGENRLGERHYEFYPDARQLDALILRLFYAPK